VHGNLFFRRISGFFSLPGTPPWPSTHRDGLGAGRSLGLVMKMPVGHQIFLDDQLCVSYKQ